MVYTMFGISVWHKTTNDSGYRAIYTNLMAGHYCLLGALAAVNAMLPLFLLRLMVMTTTSFDVMKQFSAHFIFIFVFITLFYGCC